MAAEGGNRRERIVIESGELVLIDQFMLANPQFVDKMKQLIDEEPEAKRPVINDFGGVIVDLEPGTYRIDRDPFAFSIVVYPEGDEPERDEIAQAATDSEGVVFVDTRCLAMVDRELLDDSSLLDRYRHLWFDGQDKACRDLLRDNGGAVRYGFERYGDELTVFRVPDDDLICLRPAKE